MVIQLELEQKIGRSFKTDRRMITLNSFIVYGREITCTLNTRYIKYTFLLKSSVDTFIFYILVQLSSGIDFDPFKREMIYNKHIGYNFNAMQQSVY